jgi:hypothetical protein
MTTSPKEEKMVVCTTREEDRRRLLIVYATHEDNVNVQFFLRHGMGAFDPRQTGRSDSEPSTSSTFIDTDRVDFIFALNGLTLQIANFPIDNPRVTVLRRENVGYDFGAWSEALTTVSNLDAYTHYCFMNSASRGPFFPAWIDHRRRTAWWRVFVDRLSADVKLVGATINVQIDPERPCATSFPHVQSMVLVTDRVGLGVALRNGVFAPLSSCESKEHIMADREIGWSQHILDAGFNIACMLAAYKDVDFRNVRRSLSFARRFAAHPGTGDLLYTDRHFGTTVHPYECVFFKTNRDMTPDLLAHVTACRQTGSHATHHHIHTNDVTIHLSGHCADDTDDDVATDTGTRNVSAKRVDDTYR